MRLWSIHPRYLDAKGLIALWREALLAKHVLEGKTKGYTNHPQLYRFKKSKFPLDAINQYLIEVFIEAGNRNYNFDKHKIDLTFKPGKIAVTNKQIEYEVEHLLQKLLKRDIEKYNKLKKEKKIQIHPLFKLIKGDIEKWEILSQENRL